MPPTEAAMAAGAGPAWPGRPALPPRLPPLALYVHLPWCVRKCPYCDFNSHVPAGALPERAYVDALLADLDLDLAAVAGRSLQSVYLGGGTPSLFSPEALARLLDGVRRRLALVADAEITLEANPGTLRAGYFAELRACGINRISVGVQSFDERHLHTLGRIHDAAAARATVAAVQAAGFGEINIDLMAGLPGQDVAQALADVEAALALAPTHLSHYQLTIEPGTAFARRPPRVPADATVIAQQTACRERLAAAGFDHYEVSALARPGHAARHNVHYWRFGDYLGIGAGAHAKLSGADGIRRRTRLANPARYLDAAGSEAAVAETLWLDAGDAAVEFLLNGLRLRQGFDPALFEQRTGVAWATQQPAAARAQALGLLEYAAGRWRASARGWALLDTLLGLFLPER
jgi:oxygen-independent coproporphyrinogen-3 oxidase